MLVKTGSAAAAVFVLTLFIAIATTVITTTTITTTAITASPLDSPLGAGQIIRHRSTTSPIEAPGPAHAPHPSTHPDIPADYLVLYHRAAATCPGLNWSILAAIGKIESDHGRSMLPGVRSGGNLSAGAEGVMQFMPATWANVTAHHPIPPGGETPPSPYNAHDAIYTAAAYLCDNGAGSPTSVAHSVYLYNHSTHYVAAVLAQAHRYRDQNPQTLPNPTPSPTPGRRSGDAPSPLSPQLHPLRRAGPDSRVPGAAPLPRAAPPQTAPPPSAHPPSATAAAAVWFARSQLGQKYVWGGNGAIDGRFDCSGLTKAAYAAAGITLPRTAQTQFNADPRLPPSTTPQPGDLLFYGTNAHSVTHVGLAISATHMIDAPNSGQLVKIEQIHRATLVGITRPAH